MSPNQPPLEPWSRDVAALLDAERASPDPSPDVTARVWQGVQTAAAATPAATAPSSPAPAAAGGLLSGKAAAVALATLLGGVAGASLHAWLRADTVRVVLVDRPVLVPVPAPLAAAVAPAQQSPPAAPTPAPAARPTVASKPAPAVTTPPPAAPAAPAATSTLEEEAALLDQARQALVRNNHVGALDAVARHRARFAQGALAQDRDALEVRALLSRGDVDAAKAAARAFLERYPASIHTRTMERTLEAGKANPP